ncbi:MAG: hypothetical protein EAZ60_24610 [Oscillatoriales cyanobacterium]|nr:MAG: hypothetical protein EAZ60_24610 [Oscillatoriales cyanobacterium]
MWFQFCTLDCVVLPDKSEIERCAAENLSSVQTISKACERIHRNRELFTDRIFFTINLRLFQIIIKFLDKFSPISAKGDGVGPSPVLLL